MGAAAIIIIIAAALLATVSVRAGWYLTLRGGENGETCVRYRLDEGDWFCVGFIHSVHKNPLIDCYQIQEHKIRILHQLQKLTVERFLMCKRCSGGVQTGVYICRFCSLKQLQEKIHLQKRFPSADSDSAFCTPIRTKAECLLDQFFRSL